MVPPNDLLKRMEALNRRPLKDRAPERKDADPPPEDRERPRRSARPPQAPVMPTATLGDMPTGVEVQSDAGPALLVTTDVDTYDADCAGLSAKFREQVDDRESPFHRNVARRGELNIRGVEDVLFVDLETTGLSNTPVFLIGAMVWDGSALSVRQYFARSLDEERAILSLFAELLSPATWLVTFNGKSFDWPFVQNRAYRHGVDVPFHGTHVDLLHVGRRVWGDNLPNCRLQTLERFICDRTRVGDIPSSEIPAAYRRFTRTGDASEMASVLEHNALDLITLADLITRLPADVARAAPRRRRARR
ncbi:ribonuclease H-like domain-containing protein [Candidatus Poribacteria bacterium]|jgi:uncharacterized protein YprB with RNaseH-like and TPR domain|nr:ribonuclease H-like domain-containing protein [Candidatus Poribacteria bacterium]MBT5535908.1 ribonuclease H-like domain-containing protein [Candidatus Poribacteria bacterium]MBT7100262.1 ribonuclease H-like domain-containing protein [Candidatus Poribacteria bacterium]MBT7808979.1 ribonuclease H-like domain-containing protein [Candidatus Poribacteria bacterium]